MIWLSTVVGGLLHDKWQLGMWLEDMESALPGHFSFQDVKCLHGNQLINPSHPSLLPFLSLPFSVQSFPGVRAAVTSSWWGRKPAQVRNQVRIIMSKNLERLSRDATGGCPLVPKDGPPVVLAVCRLQLGCPSRVTGPTGRTLKSSFKQTKKRKQLIYFGCDLGLQLYWA